MSDTDATDDTGASPFEAIRHTTVEGAEYWSARELMTVLDYRTWLKFKPVIKKAEEACEASGQAVSDHMSRVEQMIATGKGAHRAVEDYQLSRYACYLVVMNGDPEKSIVALGQTYFAVRTREAELAEEAALQGLSRDQARLYMRARMTDYNKQLAGRR